MPHSQPTASQQTVQISLGPSMPYIPLGVYHTEGFNTMFLRLKNDKLGCERWILSHTWLCHQRSGHDVYCPTQAMYFMRWRWRWRSIMIGCVTQSKWGPFRDLVNKICFHDMSCFARSKVSLLQTRTIDTQMACEYVSGYKVSLCIIQSSGIAVGIWTDLGLAKFLLFTTGKRIMSQ